MTHTPHVLVTGASSGIGAAYSERFAQRGHDLVLVARDTARLEALADRLRGRYGVGVDVRRADLSRTADLAVVEARLRDDDRVGILVNNAGVGLAGAFDQQDIPAIDRLVAVNTTALVRLAAAVAPRFAAQGQGAIINIGSIVGLVPEFGQTVYGATKAFVLYLSQGMSHELGSKGVYVQAVLPGATRTEIWERAGAQPGEVPPLMEVEDLVDAALVGFDRKEAVTIPHLHDVTTWDAYQTARLAMIPGFGEVVPANRYRTAS